MDKHKLTIRRVTKDDHDKVMAIDPSGEIYGGTDYLPDYFQILIDMPNVEAYAVLDGDQFISFTLLTMVDNGKTVVPRAGRTHKDYVGHGVTGLFLSLYAQLFTERHIQYQAATGGSHVKAIHKQINSRALCKVLEQEFRYYSSTKSDIVRSLQTQANNGFSAKLITVDELGEMLSNKNISHRLFTATRVIVDWVPYRPMKSNASLIKTKRTSIVSSPTKEVKDTLLTFFNYFHAPLGLVCNFDIYGHLNSRLKEHLLIHLDNILPHVRSEKVVIRMFNRQETDWNFVSNLMKELIFDETEVWGSGLICTEKKIEQSYSRL